MNIEHAYSDTGFARLSNPRGQEEHAAAFVVHAGYRAGLRFPKLPWLFVIIEEYLIAVALLIKNSRAPG